MASDDCTEVSAVDDVFSTLDDVRAALKAHPAVIAWDNWYALRQTYEAVWARNHAALLLLLSAPSRDPKLATELMQHIRLPIAREQYGGEVARLLHNYCAGSGTLIDHSRRIVNDYTNSEFRQEYQKRKIAVAGAPESSFIKGLRNFMLHRSLPTTGHTVTFTNSGDGPSGVDVEVHLIVSQLLVWPDWSKSARHLMALAGDTLPIAPLIIRHGHLIKGLTSWMMGQFGRLHDAGLDDANRLITKYNHLVTSTPPEGPSIVIRLGGEAGLGELIARRAVFRTGGYAGI